MTRTLSVTGLSLAVLMTAAAMQPANALAQVNATDGAGFVGAWVLPLDAQGQQFSLNINITENDEGNLAATVTGFEGQDEAVEEISLDEGALVLEYEGNAQGQFFPVKLTLKPDGEELDAAMDIADGAFAIDGTASRREN